MALVLADRVKETTAALGYDVSEHGTDFTVVNMTTANQSTDVPP